MATIFCLNEHYQAIAQTPCTNLFTFWSNGLMMVIKTETIAINTIKILFCYTDYICNFILSLYAKQNQMSYTKIIQFVANQLLPANCC